MSDGEMFTLDDAENDGLIKREVGTQLVANLKRSAPKLYTMFENVCEEQELSPKEVMGDHALRAINNQEHSQMLADIRVDMSQVNQDEVRIEDAQFIQELSSALGLDSEEKEDPIDRLIERRLEAKAGPMLPGASRDVDGEVSPDVKRELDTIKERMAEIQSSITESDIDSESGEKKKDIDDIFESGDSDSGGSDSDTDTVEEKDEAGDAPDVDDSGPDGGDEVDVDEFLEGGDGEDDDVDELFSEAVEEDDGDEEDGEEDDVSPPIEPDGIPPSTDEGGEIVDSTGGVDGDE